MTEDAARPIVWAIRYTQWAIRDISAAWLHFAESVDGDTADAWEEDLKAEIAKLAQFPQRHAVEDDDIFSLPIRKMTYRRTRRGPAYFVYFTLRINTDDAPTLLIMHLRHAAKAPLTRKEAQAIEAAE